MLFEFYYKTIKPLSMVLFFILIGLLIAILVVNNKLLDYVNKNDDKKFQENLKIQKALIWTNFSIIILFFLYLFIISFYFFTPRFQRMYNRTKYAKTIFLFCLIPIFTGLTYYVHKSINEINILNAKDELKKIYIIIPIISIISLSLLMYNFSITDSTLTYINNYLIRYQLNNISSITRNSSPSLSNLSENEEFLHNRYSPYLIDEIDGIEY